MDGEFARAGPSVLIVAERKMRSSSAVVVDVIAVVVVVAVICVFPFDSIWEFACESKPKSLGKEMGENWSFRLMGDGEKTILHGDLSFSFCIFDSTSTASFPGSKY